MVVVGWMMRKVLLKDEEYEDWEKDERAAIKDNGNKRKSKS